MRQNGINISHVPNVHSLVQSNIEDMWKPSILLRNWKLVENFYSPIEKISFKKKHKDSFSEEHMVKGAFWREPKEQWKRAVVWSTLL